MWSFVKIKTLCTCINSENNLQFTISISPKLWNNSMGFQCWLSHKNTAKKGNQIHIQLQCLKLKFMQYPAIHTNYSVSNCTISN